MPFYPSIGLLPVLVTTGRCCYHWPPHSGNLVIPAGKYSAI